MSQEKKSVRRISKICCFILCLLSGFFISTTNSYALGVYLDFDNFNVTPSDGVPAGATDGSWTYHSTTTDPWSWISHHGWRDETEIETGIYQYLAFYFSDGNDLHIGMQTYGFMEIDDQNAVRGNSLKITTTGGVDDADLATQLGSVVLNKEQYLSILDAGTDPVYHGDDPVGHPYVYFMSNTSLSNSYVAFPVAKGANKMSMYIYLPEGHVNGTIEDASYSKSPSQTISMGPYAEVPNEAVYPSTHSLYAPGEVIGGHWYNTYYNEGGGWTHILAETHPNHNNSFSNATIYPYPSSSMRNLGLDFYNNLFRNYLTLYPYSGVATTPYYTYLDEIEFILDSEPQNNETINNPGVTYYPDDKHFSIGWNDKYKNNAKGWSTYEIRYSFSQITNANWADAKLVSIIDDPRYNEVSSSGLGRIKKHWPYYLAIFGQITIDTEDKARLVNDTTIYFAIKDVSQDPTDTLDPISSQGGRDYRNYGTTFDYAGDVSSLPLIKRIDFYISETMSQKSNVYPVIQSISLRDKTTSP